MKKEKTQPHLKKSNLFEQKTSETKYQHFAKEKNNRFGRICDNNKQHSVGTKQNQSPLKKKKQTHFLFLKKNFEKTISSNKKNQTLSKKKAPL